MTKATFKFDVTAAVNDYRLEKRKTAVIIGGTNGIGAATARRLARVGVSKLVIVGRNPEKRMRVNASCWAKMAFQEGAKDTDLDGRFVQADVSTRAGAQQCAKDVAAAVDEIDYLVMTQSGVPGTTLRLNNEGDDIPFAVQCLSRFIISHSLITAGKLAPGAVVLTVANVGQTLDGLEVSDLNLKEMLPQCKTSLGAFMAQSARDSCVLDAFITEQIARYPQYKFFHIYPGLVSSEGFNTGAFPFPLNWMTWLLLMTPLARTPESMADVVTYTLLEPDNVYQLAGRFFGAAMNKMAPGKWASDQQNRQALWHKLVQTTLPTPEVIVGDANGKEAHRL